MTCRAWRVRGRVQGVFFRASAREAAQRLGVSGYAANLADGRVEVAACGAEEALGQFEAWLREGPPHARVDALEEVSAPDDAPAGFHIR